MEKHTSKPKASVHLESAHDILHRRPHPLDVYFAPQAVAVIGATENPGSVGRTLFWNLISNPFGGAVFPVNPKRSNVLGVKAYPNIDAVPEQVDLAVIVTPARSVPAVVGECVDAGVKAAIVISAGFKELGPEGAKLEQEILIQARRGPMRIIGPNCLGVMSPTTGLNATFAAAMARPGDIGFLSQSGALCTAVLDWSLRELVGFSAFVSIGSMADVGWGDLIDYLGDDPRTRSIILYMESIGDARSFLSAAREVSLTKPIIVIKAGRSEAAAKAAASHTGSLAGSDEVLSAAFRRTGVLRVITMGDLFHVAEVLGKQPRPTGPRLAILTNAGGPGVLATDSLIAVGGELAELSEETLTALNAILPKEWSHGNPIDILGDATPERYAKALEIVSKDPNTDGLLTVLTPQAMTDPTQIAERLKTFAKLEGKPILASWMGGAGVAAGEAILNHTGIPTFAYPDTAARIFCYMWQYSYNLRGLYETPVPITEFDQSLPGRAEADKIIQAARQAGRSLLTEVESKQLLAAYGIPTVETRVAKSADEAVALAEQIGYPVVLKLYSETITHKTDVGGVRLNLRDAQAVRGAFQAIETSVREKAGAEHLQGVAVQPMVKLDGYELIIGSSMDAQFGPVLLFGTGGQLVEVFKDRALALPPLNTTLARRMMEQTKIFRALRGVRGRKPVDLAALEQLMVRFSYLVVEQRWIKEIDINPLLASPERLVALDARVVLHGPEVTEEQIPKLPIRPYPSQYIKQWALSDGTPVTIRPILPEDEPLMVKFHGRLSEQSVFMRYFHMIALSQRVTHERLTRICFNDYDRELAFVVDRKDPKLNTHEILAVARLTRVPGTDEAQFASTVIDRYQGHGLGTELLRHLLEVGRQEKIRRVTAEILLDNTAMQHVSKKLGFQLKQDLKDGVVRAEIEL
ncbi:MAG: bifunctional acetate--CoA ligase family protein/GNAT family N-acetyltransferase [Acidobacteriia bacterium]|nr:bifunctional acetate--CoA ligase family protein/GNAT family N-acetyltransferase [Terriglobia bacterium]